MKKSNVFIKFAIALIIIAIILVVVGFVRDDYLWFIRAGIFCVTAGYLFWREKVRVKK